MTNLKTNTTNIFTDLPGWAKGIIAIIILLIIVFILYKIYKLFKSQAEKDAAKSEQDQIASQIAEIKKNESKMNQSYTNGQYLSYADTIFNSLNGCSVAGLDAAIQALKSMKNNLDVAELEKAYGFKQRSCLGIDFQGKDGLFQSIATATAHQRYKDSVNPDWAKKNITYRV